MPSVLIHVMNEDPILGEIDHLPSNNDTIVILKNPRRRDGKDVHYLDHGVTTVVWPVARLTFMEVLPSEDEEDIISHVREDTHAR